MKSKERYENIKRIHLSEGETNYHLDVFGDHLAQREGYKEVDGIEAVRFYLMTKHHWMPAQVRTMSFDDLHFALAEELSGWTLPAESRV